MSLAQISIPCYLIFMTRDGLPIGRFVCWCLVGLVSFENANMPGSLLYVQNNCLILMPSWLVTELLLVLFSQNFHVLRS